LEPAVNFRLFVALPVSAEVKSTIERAQAELRRAIPDTSARWAHRDQFHLTLRFLGNVEVSRVESLVKAMKTACQPFAPLRLTARKLGFFPNARSPRVLWVGVEDEQEQRLPELSRALNASIQPFAVERPEESFVGHVSLARLNRMRRPEAEALIRAAKKLDGEIFGNWPAAQVELMRSELSPQGARHSVLAAVPLLGK
jgi:2'-5' RNA ligase